MARTYKQSSSDNKRVVRKHVQQVRDRALDRADKYEPKFNCNPENPDEEWDEKA